MRKNSALIFLIVFVLASVMSSDLRAQGRQRFGLSLGVGGGLLYSKLVSRDLSYEADWLTDVYGYASYSPAPPEMFFLKELQLAADLGFIRFGLAVGLSNHSYLSHWRFESVWQDWDEDRNYDISMVPVSLSLSVYPLRMSNANLPFQMFLGGFFGSVSQSVSENDHDAWSGVGPLVGLEVFLGELFVLGLEARYLFDLQTHYLYEDKFSYRDSSLTALFNIRFRIPFVRRQF